MPNEDAKPGGEHRDGARGTVLTPEEALAGMPSQEGELPIPEGLKGAERRKVEKKLRLDRFLGKLAKEVEKRENASKAEEDAAAISIPLVLARFLANENLIVTRKHLSAEENPQRKGGATLVEVSKLLGVFGRGDESEISEAVRALPYLRGFRLRRH